MHFAIKCKNSAGTVLQFEHLCSNIRLSSSSNVNIIASMPAVRLFIGSALTMSFGLACRGYPFDGRGAFNVGLLFQKASGLGLGFTFKVYV